MKRIIICIWAGISFFSVAVANELATDNLTVYNQSDLYGPLVVHYRNANISTNGLILYYDFATNSTPVEDKSGQGNSGTVYGATWCSNSIHGGGYSFDGVNDYISVGTGTISRTGAPLTIAAWIKSDSATFSGYPAILVSQPVNGYGLLVYQTSAKPYFAKVGVNSVMASNSIADTAWHHVAVVYATNNTVCFYIDGQVDSGGAQSYSTTFTGGLEYDVGGRGGIGDYFDGLIDELLVYNRTLSAAEIFDLYLATGTSTNDQSGTVMVSNTLTVANAVIQQNTQGTNVFMGKLGVGTNQPTTLLDVNGDATVRGALTVNGGLTGSGTGLSELSATNLSSGIVPLARLSGITSNEMAASERAILDGAQNASQVIAMVTTILSTNVASDGRRAGIIN